MKSFDSRQVPEAKREALAWRIRNLSDVKMPNLESWNDKPCDLHAKGWTRTYLGEDGSPVTEEVTDEPKPGCRQCGASLRAHQRVGALWLYYKKKALLADTVGLGKALPVSEPVLTPAGWKPMGTLSVGDRVIGSDGKPTKVTGVFPQEGTQVYRMTFSDGATVRCSPDHLWQVETVSGKKYLATAQELYEGADHTATWNSAGVELSRTFSFQLTGANGRSRWAIPTVKPVEFDSVELDCDPYVLGIWIGDGSANGMSLNAEDAPHILEQFQARGVSYNPPRHESENCISVSFNHRSVLPSDVIDKRSWEKIIPERYLLASPENRLALLQGLMDSDGSPIQGGGAEFSTTSQNVRDAVVFLTQSLGGLARVGNPRRTAYTHKGEKREGRESYRINVKLPSEFDTFTVPRKLESWVRPTKYPVRRFIKSIEPDHPEATVCISVDAEDSLFVTSNFAVTHNTYVLAGLLSLMAETGELGKPSKGGKGGAIIVPRAPALHQWAGELKRVLPDMKIMVADVSAAKRKKIYMSDWDILLVGPETFRNDYKEIAKFPRSILVTDDVDPMRNAQTQTSRALDFVGERTDRYVITSGTPLQKKLPEMHQVTDAIGGKKIFGSLKDFTKMYVKMDKVPAINPKTGERFTRKKITGYHNLDDFKTKLAPLVLRRTAKDVKDVKLPVIQPNDIYLELYPKQRKKYQELQKGVVRLLKEEGELVKNVTALSRIHYGAAICAGLAALGEEDAPGTSVKIDYLMQMIGEDGDLGEEKVVVFANLKSTVRVIQQRMRDAGIGFVTIWGEETDKSKRMEAQNRFWDDPSCRVLIGTRAIEQSLNLQVSRHLVNVDMILNPARMEQLAGRVRRQGSEYSQVFVHNLLTTDTQEQRYMEMIETEAALSGHVWEEQSELFKAISSTDLLKLISGG